MKNLPSNFELDRYGLHVRLVREGGYGEIANNKNDNN